MRHRLFRYSRFVLTMQAWCLQTCSITLLPVREAWRARRAITDLLWNWLSICFWISSGLFQLQKPRIVNASSWYPNLDTQRRHGWQNIESLFTEYSKKLYLLYKVAEKARCCVLNLDLGNVMSRGCTRLSNADFAKSEYGQIETSLIRRPVTQNWAFSPPTLTTQSLTVEWLDDSDGKEFIFLSKQNLMDYTYVYLLPPLRWYR